MTVAIVLVAFVAGACFGAMIVGLMVGGAR